MKNLEDVAKGVWHSQRVLILLFEFTEAAINPPDTYKVMEPLLLDILVHAVLPSCYFTAADAQQWEEDPMEVRATRLSSTAEQHPPEQLG